MSATFFAAVAALLPLADPQPPKAGTIDNKIATETPRKVHPFAPSLPKLSEAEEKKIDAVVRTLGRASRRAATWPSSKT